MNLKNLDDSYLIEHTEALVQEERELLTRVLHCLREIDRRRLYSSMGYKSLFDFTSRHLGYPEDQAYRRIAAMKLLKEIPEIEEQIQSGEISLTHIGLAQSLFRHEKKIDNEMSREQKIEIFAKIASKPVREAEHITMSLTTSPESAKPDRITFVSETHVELKFIATSELQKKIEVVKGLIAHTNPNISLGDLFEQLCDLAVTEWVPKKSAAPRKRRVTNPDSRAQILKTTFQLANNRCENCGSHYALEVDHIQPRAKGGGSTVDNLRILCRSCNQRSAIEHFGQQKMDLYLN